MNVTGIKMTDAGYKSAPAGANDPAENSIPFLNIATTKPLANKEDAFACVIALTHSFPYALPPYVLPKVVVCPCIFTTQASRLLMVMAVCVYVLASVGLGFERA